MKKLIPSLAILLIAVSHAGAQAIDFRNTVVFDTPGNRDVYLNSVSPGNELVGTAYMVQLYYGANAGSLQALTTPALRFRDVAASDPLAGTWSGGGQRTLTGFNVGDIVTIQLRAWDSRSGATFDAAGIRGQSATFTYQIPAAGSLPSDFYMEGLSAFAVIVPEPSVIALGVIGAGALFMLRRRK